MFLLLLNISFDFVYGSHRPKSMYTWVSLSPSLIVSLPVCVCVRVIEHVGGSSAGNGDSEIPWDSTEHRTRKWNKLEKGCSCWVYAMSIREKERGRENLSFSILPVLKKNCEISKWFLAKYFLKFTTVNNVFLFSGN